MVSGERVVVVWLVSLTVAVAVASGGPLQLVTSDRAGIVLELVLPGIEIEKGSAAGEPCDLLRSEGQVMGGEPGLPRVSALVGLPPEGDPGVEVLAIEWTELEGSWNLCAGRTSMADSGTESQNAFLPIAELGRPALMRSQRVVSLSLWPVQIHPDTGLVRFAKRLRVRVDFGMTTTEISPLGVSEGPYEEVLRNGILNYEQARAFRTQRPAEGAPDREPIATSAVKLLVDQDGLYRVTYAELQTAGLPVDTLDPRTFRLEEQGNEVRIELEGQDDGSFDSSDLLLFYGRQVHSRYTAFNVYRLTWGGAVGLRISEADGSPGAATALDNFRTTYRAEQDLIYESSLASAGEDRWYWDRVTAPGASSSKDFSIGVFNASTDPAQTATISGVLRGGFSVAANHRVKVLLNGSLIVDDFFALQTEHSFFVDVQQTLLVEDHLGNPVPGPSIITVECPAAVADFVYVNFFDVEYADTYVAEGDVLFFDGDEAGTWQFQVTGFTDPSLEVLDISDAAAPIRITNSSVEADGPEFRLVFDQTIGAERNYLTLAEGERLAPALIVDDLPSDLKNPANGADYIVVSHADFLTELQPLVAWRAGEGLRTFVADVEDVYDEFSGGVFSPDAIRDFLAYAYNNWQPPAPSYVLLVGDGHFDPKDNMGNGVEVFVPVYLADVDQWWGETAVDNRFVTVSGGDILPDMSIGRLPVTSPAEAAGVVGKILSYEQNPPADGWNSSTLFVADDADAAGDFAALSDSVADTVLPPSYSVQKVYYGVTHGDPGIAAADIVSAINLGRLVVNYFGQAGIPQWAAENLLEVASIPLFSNSDRLPLTIAMAPWSGYFHFPGTQCLAESLVLAPGAGAIASLSTTGTAVATGHATLDQGLFEALFFDGGAPVGVAAVAAKMELFGTGSSLDLIDTFTLFGDPALRLHLLDLSLVAEMVDGLIDLDGDSLPGPGDTIRYDVTISNPDDAGDADHSGVVFGCVPDANTTLIAGSVVTSQGAVTSGNGGGDSEVIVDVGTVTESGVVVMSFEVTVNDPMPPLVDTISVSGIVTSDSLTGMLTDDPDSPGNEDPTTTSGVVPVELLRLSVE